MVIESQYWRLGLVLECHPSQIIELYVLVLLRCMHVP